MPTDRYETFDAIRVEHLDDGILRFGMRFDLVERAHGQMGQILKVINDDPDVRIGIVAGDTELGAEGLDLMKRVAQEWDVRLRVMQEAADLVYNTLNCTKPLVSVIPGAVLPVGLLADISIAPGAPSWSMCIPHMAQWPATMLSLLAAACAVWPRRSTTCLPASR